MQQICVFSEAYAEVHRTLLYLLLLHGAHIIVTVEVYEPDVE